MEFVNSSEFINKIRAAVQIGTSEFGIRELRPISPEPSRLRTRKGIEKELIKSMGIPELNWIQSMHRMHEFQNNSAVAEKWSARVPAASSQGL